MLFIIGVLLLDTLSSTAHNFYKADWKNKRVYGCQSCPTPFTLLPSTRRQYFRAYSLGFQREKSEGASSGLGAREFPDSDIEGRRRSGFCGLRYEGAHRRVRKQSGPATFLFFFVDSLPEFTCVQYRCAFNV